jgi:hypothetical protein
MAAPTPGQPVHGLDPGFGSRETGRHGERANNKCSPPGSNNCPRLIQRRLQYGTSYFVAARETAAGSQDHSYCRVGRSPHGTCSAVRGLTYVIGWQHLHPDCGSPVCPVIVSLTWDPTVTVSAVLRLELRIATRFAQACTVLGVDRRYGVALVANYRVVRFPRFLPWSACVLTRETAPVRPRRASRDDGVKASNSDCGTHNAHGTSDGGCDTPHTVSSPHEKQMQGRETMHIVE